MSVDIVIRAIDEATGTIKTVNVALDGTATTTTKAATATKAASMSFTEFNSVMALGRQGLELLNKGYDASIGKSQAYAEQIRNLQNVSGESAENTSRFVQFLDDYQISAEDAMLATKALTKEGYAPTIETLIKLSKEYLALGSIEEQNAFLTRNLGKAGLEWVNALKQGPDAIRAQSAAIEQGLIRTQKMQDESEKLRLSQDRLNDSWEALTLTVSSQATPAFTAWVDLINQATSGQVDWGKAFSDAYTGQSLGIFTAYGDQFNKNAAEIANMTAQQKENAAAAENMADAQQRVADANTQLLGAINTLQAAEDAYTQKSNDLSQQRLEILEKIAQTPAWDTEHLAEYQGKLGEIAGKEAQLEIDRDRQSKQFIFQLIQQSLAADGLTNAETAALLKQGEEWGLFSAKVATEAAKAIADANRIAGAINAIPTNKNVSVNVMTNYNYASNNTAGGTDGDPATPRDSGGPGTAGRAYLIGRGAQPEMFIPSTNGQFVPNADKMLGGGSGITINLTYSPGISMHAESDIQEFVGRAVRQLQADGKLPVGAG